MIKSLITDPRNKEQAFIDQNSLYTAEIGCPPLIVQKKRIYSQFLETAAGSNDMGIDGSTTAVEFFVQAPQNADLYITAISIVIGYGTSAQLWEFADANAALTNGVQIYYEDARGDIVEIANPKTNLAFLRFNLSTSNTNWESRGFTVLNDYGYFTAVNLLELMPPYGIKLDMGTSEKLAALVRDDCTDADLFNIRVFGFERLK